MYVFVNSNLEKHKMSNENTRRFNMILTAEEYEKLLRLKIEAERHRRKSVAISDIIKQAIEEKYGQMMIGRGNNVQG